MKKKTRKEELIKIEIDRLHDLDILLLLPPNELSDEEFNSLKQEAVRLRETLKMLL